MKAKRKDSLYSIKKHPRVGTSACKNYFITYTSLNRFSYWIMFMVTRLDEGAEIAHKALLLTYDDETKKKRKEDFSKRRKMIDELKVNRQVFIEIQLIRHIDNFLNYLSDLLWEIFIQRPDTLKSSEQVELSDVLRHESIEELVKSIAERQVEKLSYQSFSDLSEFFFKRFRIKLFDEHLHSLIIEAIEIRNLATHNRCIINKRFCKRVGLDISKLGTKLELGIDDLDRILPELAHAVVRIDKNARTHLKLKGVRFKTNNR